MAELSFSKEGRRWPNLARLIAESDPKATLEETDDALVVSGPILVVTRKMVERACFPQGARHPASVTKILYWLALNARKGELISQSEERIVLGDDRKERMISLRVRPDLLHAADGLAEELKMSRNDFIVGALERFIRFLEESRELVGVEADEGESSMERKKEGEGCD